MCLYPTGLEACLSGCRLEYPTRLYRVKWQRQRHPVRDCFVNSPVRFLVPVPFVPAFRPVILVFPFVVVRVSVPAARNLLAELLYPASANRVLPSGVCKYRRATDWHPVCGWYPFHILLRSGRLTGQSSGTLRATRFCVMQQRFTHVRRAVMIMDCIHCAAVLTNQVHGAAPVGIAVGQHALQLKG